MNLYRSKLAARRLRVRWRKQNQHNSTTLGLLPRSPSFFDVATVGRHTYGRINASYVGAPNSSLRIGDFCSIASDVLFLLGDEHGYTTLSTFPFKVKMSGDRIEARSKGPVVVEDDVWIGERVTVLSGITIHQGAIIAAGSIVTRDLPPYSIAGGCPAKVIKYRFSPTVIAKLSQFRFGQLGSEHIAAAIELLYTPINDENVDSLLSRLDLLIAEKPRDE